MRYREFVTEREEWNRMSSPTQQQQFDQWAQEKRGRAALTTEPTPKQTPGYTLGADSPFADTATKKTPELKYSQDLYRDAPSDEYKAVAPQSWGGRAPKGFAQDTGLEKYNIEVPKSKHRSVIDPDTQKQQKQMPLNLPGGTKEKYRT